MSDSTFSAHCKRCGWWSKSFGSKKESEKAGREHQSLWCARTERVRVSL